MAPNGSLTGLRIDDNPALAAEIMKLARRAQRNAAVKVTEAVAPLAGDSEALHMITGYVPPEEQEEEEPQAPATYRFSVEEEAAPPPPPPSPSPPHPPLQRPAPDERR